MINIDNKKLISSIFERAKLDHEWPIIRSLLTKNKSLAFIKNENKWNETLLHWAALGNMPAVLDLLSYGLNINEHDNTERTPFLWAIEKIYFLSTDKPKEMSKKIAANEISKTETTALLLLNNGALPFNKINLGYSPLELTLKAGQENLPIEIIKLTQGKESNENIWSWFIQGNWENSDAFVKMADQISKITKTDYSSFLINGNSIGCFSLDLYLKNIISLNKLKMINKFINSVDTENPDGTSSVDIFIKNDAIDKQEYIYSVLDK